MKRIARWLSIAGTTATLAGCSGADGDANVRIAPDSNEGEEVGSAQQAAISGTVVTPTPVYTGIYTSGTSTEELRFGMTAAQLETERSALAGRGFRLVQLVANVNSGAVRYNGVWNSGGATQVIKTALTPAQFDGEYAGHWFLGYSLTSFTTHVSGGQLLVSGVFTLQAATEAYSVNRSQAELQGDYDAQRAAGMRLSHLSASNVAGVTRYSGIWLPSTSGQELKMNQTEAQFVSEQTTQAARGYRLVSVAITAVDGVRRYHSVYHQSASVPVVLERLNEANFRTQNGRQRTAGRRLVRLAANEDSLNITRMADEVHTAFNRLNNHPVLCPAPAAPCIQATVGSAVTIASGATRERRVTGFRRTAADSPQRASTNTAAMNLASVSKTITGAAVQEALADNTTADLNTRIQNFLPTAWRMTLGTGVGDITMRELLTHTSGLPAWDPNAVSFNELRTLLQQPVSNQRKLDCRTIVAADGSERLPNGCYLNQGFALFRIIVPYLAGYVEGANIDADTATFFRNYVNTRILNPISAGPAATAPPASEPTLYYTYPAGNVTGVGFGDWFLRTGSAGLHLSSDQVANFLVDRYAPAAIGGPAAVEQDTLLLGWQGSDMIRHGRSRFHGGYLFMPNPTPRNGNHEVNTMAVSICQDTVTPATTCVGGVHAGLLINSKTNGIDGYATIRNAYANNWMTTY